MYFGRDVELAIDEYNRSESEIHREKLFTIKIYPALCKLAENVIHNKKFYNYGANDYSNVKHDCVVFMHEKLAKFDINRGHKAFSYFNRVAINWIWAQMKEIGGNQTGRCKLESVDYDRNLNDEFYEIEYQEELKDFCKKWSIWGNAHLDYFYFMKSEKVSPFTKRDKKIANAIFNLFENVQSIDIYNKKALYIMVREQVDVKTQYITDVVNVLKPLCKEMYFDFKNNGTRFWHRFLYYPENVEGEFNFEELIDE